jgi:cytochrome c
MLRKSKYKFWIIGVFALACVIVIVLLIVRPSPASAPERHFGFGRAPEPQEIQRLDIDVRPDGKGLPAGRGTAKAGLLIYNEKCLACHGNGEPSVIKLPGGELFSKHPTDKVKNIGNYWPYATTIFDYVRRAMPYNAPGSLTNQEVYDLTAYLLFANGIIQENFVVDQKSLPAVVMPAKSKFVNDDRTGGNTLR